MAFDQKNWYWNEFFEKQKKVVTKAEETVKNWDIIEF